MGEYPSSPLLYITLVGFEGYLLCHRDSHRKSILSQRRKSLREELENNMATRARERGRLAYRFFLCARQGARKHEGTPVEWPRSQREFNGADPPEAGKPATGTVAILSNSGIEHVTKANLGRLTGNSYSATGNERTRILSLSKTAIAPLSKSPRRAGKFNSRSESCCSGRRCICLRKRITDGRFSLLRANRVAKSVSLETRIRSSFVARSKMFSSNADWRR